MPPLYHTDEERVVACYLYAESPLLERQDLATVFQGGQPEP